MKQATDEVTVTHVSPFSGGEIKLTLRRVDETTVEVAHYQRRNQAGIGPWSRRKLEEGKRYPLGRLGLGVEDWDGLKELAR